MTESDPWIRSITANTALSKPERQALQEDGFVVTRGPVLTADLSGLAHAYDSAVLHADPADGKEGTPTTRVEDFVNRGPAFHGLYLHAPLLEACCRILNEPFRLSSVLARTLNPGKLPKKLHVDFPHDTIGWPMVGFIFMIDAFRPENRATCFRPRFQGTTRALDTFDGVVPACGPAGSMLIYSGSVS